MIDTVRDYEGAGLAATQVHDPRRVMLVRVSDEEEGGGQVLALINPEMRPIGESRSEDWEGCLSIPDIRGRVSRWDAVAVDAVDTSGAPVSFDARGFAARAIQHEIDHLDGILFLDRMDDLRSLSFIEEYARFAQDPASQETDP
jgi:peptide deformylase